MRRDGFSIVELLVVMTLIGILLAIATFNWGQMHTKSAIESQIKMIHADLMEIRLQALYSKTPRSVVISGQQYQAYSSAYTSVAPLVSKRLTYPVTWTPSTSTTLTFDAQGLMIGNEKSLCVLPTNDTTVVNSADVDSIVVSQARINLGWRNGGDCNSGHINQK